MVGSSRSREVGLARGSSSKAAAWDPADAKQRELFLAGQGAKPAAKGGREFLIPEKLRCLMRPVAVLRPPPAKRPLYTPSTQFYAQQGPAVKPGGQLPSQEEIQTRMRKGIEESDRLRRVDEAAYWDDEDGRAHDSEDMGEEALDDDDQAGIGEEEDDEEDDVDH